MDKGPLIGRGRTADIYAWGDDQVLKLFNDWCSEGMVRYELKIARIVQSAGLPVPKVEDVVVEVDGRRGLIFERVSGPSMLAELRRQPWQVVRYGRWLAELQAQVHACRVPDLPSWCEYLERSITQAAPLPEAGRRAALRRLAELPQGDALCHGDFHPDNIVMTTHGPVVIDWITAVRGNPLADVMRSSLLLRNGQVPPGTPGRWLINLLRDTYHDAYFHRCLSLLHAQRADVEAWELPLAAARLNEGIKNEEASLRRIVARHVPEITPLNH